MDEIKKELEKEYVKLNAMKNQLNELVVQKKIIESKMNEVSETIETIDGVKNMKRGADMWASIGSGVFVLTSMKTPDKVIVDVGAGALIEKNIEEAKEFLNKKMDGLKALYQQLSQNILQYTEEAKKSEDRILELSNKKL
ncbi:MAG: prefoldin subunit alpha [Candidatus Aenigmarchaeota archaeon]|nr:prefoldin subunit alpha [Candidatus Aenigmarchaeota archaeon]